jgi:hypothetical protein
MQVESSCAGWVCGVVVGGDAGVLVVLVCTRICGRLTVALLLKGPLSAVPAPSPTHTEATPC